MKKSYWWPASWGFKLIGLHLLGHRSRSALRWMNIFAVLGLALGFFAWVSVISVMDGLQNEIKELHLSQEPHLLWEGTPRSEQRVKLLELESTEGVREVRVYLQSEALLELPSRSGEGRVRGAGVMIVGRPDLQPGNIAVGSALAEKMSFGLGEALRLRSVWRLEGLPLMGQVSDFIHTGLQDLDLVRVAVNEQELQTWLGLDAAFSRVELWLYNPMQVDQVLSTLQRTHSELLSSFALKSWKETQAALWYSLKLEKFVLFFSIFFVILLASLAIYFALTVRVTEKIREIALMSALGCPRKELRKIYLWEGCVLGFVGLALGWVGSWVFCQKLLAAGLWQMPDVFYSTSIPVIWDPVRNLMMFLAAMLLALWVSWAPAKKVLDFELSQALRA